MTDDAPPNDTDDDAGSGGDAGDDVDRDTDGDTDTEGTDDSRVDADGSRERTESTPRVENPFAEPDGESGAEPSGSSAAWQGVGSGDVDAGGDAEDRADAPFGSLAAEVGERRRRDSGEDPFEQMEVSELDSEEVWESLLASEPDEAAPVGGEAERVGGDDTRPEHVVDKREYCQRCPHLSKPPAVRCTHDGTDIVEVLDGDQFRVRGCPMVGEEGGAPDFRNG
ncbi:hypothetical protein [Halobaculum sp. D14]|uniref:hypothetical protein n=1 Tax=Halobaculum sp. D14 TaxID=3421642 RepID=UPI003EC00275